MRQPWRSATLSVIAGQSADCPAAVGSAVAGSVLGSCLFNLLAVAGTVAGTVKAISGVGPAGFARQYDVPMLMLATIVVTVPLYIRQKLDRPTAVLLLAIYGLWLAARLTG